MSANITLRAPPRCKKSSKKAGRIKSSVEKGKVKRRRKSVLRKEKQAKKPTKTKPVTGKRKRSTRHDPVMEKEKAKNKTTQMKVVRKDGKIRKPQSAKEVICGDSNVEEATIFGSIPPGALEVDKNGVIASLSSASTLQRRIHVVVNLLLSTNSRRVHFAMNLIFANRDLLRTHFVCYFVDICVFF
ncbi:hypothetical protein MKW92_026638 [Papaver armeniacum]|nr:hypothetical protein MKW92_026638 [Papaver armeniacum]